MLDEAAFFRTRKDKVKIEPYFSTRMLDEAAFFRTRKEIFSTDT